MKRWAVILSMVPAVLLAGCIPPQFQKTVDAECARDSRARWLRPAPQLDNILLAQTLPPSMAEINTPQGESNDPSLGKAYALRLGTIDWDTLRKLQRLLPGKRLYAFVPLNSGTNSDAPEGVYFFPDPSDISALCPPVANLPGTKCTTARFVGRVEDTPYQYALSWEADRTYHGPADGRYLGRLTGRDGTVYAQSVNYESAGGDFIATCSSTYNLIDLIRDGLKH